MWNWIQFSLDWLWSRRGWIAWGCFLALMVASLLWANEHFYGPGSEAYERARDEHTAPNSALVVRPKGRSYELQYESRNEHPEPQFLGRSAETWIALLTFALALTTLLLWVATRRLAGVGERALTELEQPVVVVRFLQSGLFVDSQGQISPRGLFTAELVNHGRTPAMLIEGMEVYFTEPIDRVTPERVIDVDAAIGPGLPVGALSAPNAPWLIETNPIADFPARIFQPNAWREVNLYCLGYVRYRDIFGRTSRIGFCGLFDPRRNRFVLWGGKRHNYVRQERGDERVRFAREQRRAQRRATIAERDPRPEPPNQSSPDNS